VVQLVKTKNGKKGGVRRIGIAIKKEIKKILGGEPEKKYSKKQLAGTWPLREETPQPKQPGKKTAKKTMKKKPAKKTRVKKVGVKKIQKPRKQILPKQSTPVRKIHSKKPAPMEKVIASKRKGSDRMRSIKSVSLPAAPKPVKRNPKKISVTESNINELRMPSEKLRDILRESSGGELSEEKMHLMEGRIIGLMQRYQLSETEIEEDIEKLDTNRLLRDFDKLIRLVERSKKPAQLLYSEEIIGAGVAYGESPKSPKTFMKEIKKQRVLTDVDSVFDLVETKGKTSSSELSGELGIPKKKIEEYAETLSTANLVDLRYPPIGGITLMVKGFADSKKSQSDKK